MDPGFHILYLTAIAILIFICVAFWCSTYRFETRTEDLEVEAEQYKQRIAMLMLEIQCLNRKNERIRNGRATHRTTTDHPEPDSAAH